MRPIGHRAGFSEVGIDGCKALFYCRERTTKHTVICHMGRPTRGLWFSSIFLRRCCQAVGQEASRCALEKSALSENLTKRPLLRNFLHPLNCEEPTLVTAIRLAMDERHRSGWFERDAEGAGLRLNWAGHGERLDEGVGIPGLSGLSAGDRRRAPAAQVVDQAQAGESQHDLCGLRKTDAQDARGV